MIHSPGSVECRTFDVFTVLHDGRLADIGGPKQRLLLAHLVCRANCVVSVKDLLDALWGDSPPRTAVKNLQVYVSKLRRVFGDRLCHAGNGYRLSLGPGECDLLRFEALARQGRQLLRGADTEAAMDLLGQAIALWQPPLAEFADEPSLAVELGRRQELFLVVLEDWAELAVAAGDHQQALDRLGEHVRPHALRERLGAAWIRSLAAAGRVREALAHYEHVRRTLADELGVDPGPELTAVYRQLLDGAATPARSAGGQTPGNQLPRDVPDFVGRRAETGQVLAHLTSPHGLDVVLVSGPVGSGKTAFAVHVAHLLRDAYPDGQVLVDLADGDGTAKPADRVLAELLDLSGQDAGPQPLGRWRRWIARRRLLIVLDNAAHEDVVRAALPGSGSSAVIVAGSTWLSGLESVLRVQLGPLGDAESRELLGRVVGSGRVLADRDAVRRILDGCERSPLAIRIAAAKLAALRHLTLAEFADRLTDQRRVLDELAVGGLTLRDRLTRWYRGLSEQHRAACRRIAELPPPPFGHGLVAAALTGLSTSEDLLLESLLEANVLTAPDAEVVACEASYEMPAATYWLLREVVEREAAVVPFPRPNLIHFDAAGSP
ncbi:BTAD domain-containing putative transcriptional regulator [Lentzea sp. CA-135723]|uniref:AfsR/SARP family transcriptional regulator n=1 Tax=Lentzea sp. CA-135723 TaxID=3239950 RepID=UPI003D8BC91E